MARLSLNNLYQSPTRTYVVCFRILWVYLTYTAWRVIFPAIVARHRRQWNNDVTEIERLFFDLVGVCDYNLTWLCIILLIGCIVGFLPRLQTRVAWIQVVMIHLFSNFLSDCLVSRELYRVMRVRGFDIVVRYCQDNQPEGFGDLCRQAEVGAKTLVIAGIVVWKFVGLNLIALAWVWFRCTVSEEAEARAKIEREVQERAGSVRIAEEESKAVENKV